MATRTPARRRRCLRIHSRLQQRAPTQASDSRLQHVAYGASASHPNANVNWTQFEPLVGIPAVSPSDVTPYAQHWMASVERNFGSGTLATISYVGTSSHHLLVLEEANPANPALCLSLGSACGPFNEQAARTTFGPQFGSVELQRTIANANYNALEATLNHRIHGLEMLASYTYSKSIDQSAGLPEPVNPVNPSLSRGLSSFDLRHNFVASFDYTVPSFEDRGLAARSFYWLGRCGNHEVHHGAADVAREQQRHVAPGNDSERD